MDLTFVPTDDLVDEIERRCDASIVAFEAHKDGSNYARFFYHGGFSSAIGLADRMKHRLIWTDREDNGEGDGEGIL